MNESEWLNKLQVGDLVCITQSYGVAVNKVSRLTKTMIILEDGQRFSRRYGTEVNGDTWHRSSLLKPTQERLESVRYQKLRQHASALIRQLQVPNNTPDVEKFIETITPFVKAITPFVKVKENE